MGHSRRFRAGRQARRISQKEQIKALTAQVGYQQGLNMALAAELEAYKMDRPADLEEWVDSILDDFSEEEREQFESMDHEERQEFLDRLGQRINVSKALLDAGDEARPTQAGTGS